MAPSPQAPRAPTALGGQSGCESRAGQGSGAGVWRSPVLEQAVGGTRYMANSNANLHKCAYAPECRAGGIWTT